MTTYKESTKSRGRRQIGSKWENITVKLVQFDDQYEVVFDKSLADVPELTQDLFVPRDARPLRRPGQNRSRMMAMRARLSFMTSPLSSCPAFRRGRRRRGGRLGLR